MTDLTPDDLSEGTTVVHERTFTPEDVRTFTTVSGDEGDHHVETDDEGRLLVQGLLTATLPTKVGGDLNVLASRMEYEFRRPVYTGQHVSCEVTFTEVEHGDERVSVLADFEATRTDDGTVVMAGLFEGIIRHE
ncbi:dehydratase [Haloglomus litoreum]|uniref:dehydratase n=1 Tax=Haloglomus litoreum TaxID=3034026 RepID=UPI0023E822B0|nr:dehydratase [Haloglomus sp. DT116]